MRAFFFHSYLLIARRSNTNLNALHQKYMHGLSLLRLKMWLSPLTLHIEFRIKKKANEWKRKPKGNFLLRLYYNVTMSDLSISLQVQVQDTLVYSQGKLHPLGKILKKKLYVTKDQNGYKLYAHLHWPFVFIRENMHHVSTTTHAAVKRHHRRRSQLDNLLPLRKFQIIIIIHFFRNRLFSKSMKSNDLHDGTKSSG